MIWRAVGDRLAGDLADDLRGVREGAGRAWRRGRRVLVVTWSGLDRASSGMSTVATTTVAGRRRRRPVAGLRGLRDEHEDADEGDDRQEDPDEQDQPIRTLQVGSPRRDGVTGGTTLAPRQSRRDYTKGLGPLGGNGRKPRTSQGTSARLPHRGHWRHAGAHRADAPQGAARPDDDPPAATGRRCDRVRVADQVSLSVARR